MSPKITSPATTTTSSKSAAKSVATPVQEVVKDAVAVPVPVKEAVPVAQVPVPTTYDQIMEKVTSISQFSKELMSMMKIYNKEVAKSKSKSGKKEKVKKSTTNADGTPRPPSGFAVPTKLSVDLCKFLTVAEDTMMSRTEVTRHLNAYIKEKSLQNPSNKKEILPDACLKKLLAVDDTIVLSYFNLQKYMKHLFISTKK